jgi:hypothetical protein
MDTFPHPTLTPITGKPTPQTLQRLKQELVANDMSVALTNSGVMGPYIINEWKRRDATTQTYGEFKAHFDLANKVRVEELTAARAGFHTANAATVSPPDTTPATPAVSDTAAGVCVDNRINMFYCWTHGLGKNSRHTSKTCKNPAHDHKYNATIINMKGGCNTIQADNKRRTPQAPRGG